MVLLNVKHLNNSIFLVETTLTASVDETLAQIIKLHNGILKVNRVVEHLKDISEHGVHLPANMIGLLPDQISELKLCEPDVQLTEPSQGFETDPDPLQRRNGKRPTEAGRDILEKTAGEASAKVSRENVAAGLPVTWSSVEEALQQVKGAISIVYPQGVPVYEPLRMELENREDLSGTQASKQVIDPAEGVLWFASKELQTGKKLSEYLGKHEKTKVVVKLTTRSAGQPTREPLLSQDDQTRLMMANHKRKEELEALDKASRDDDSYLNSSWADPNALKRKMHGVGNVSWK